MTTAYNLAVAASYLRGDILSTAEGIKTAIEHGGADYLPALIRATAELAAADAIVNRLVASVPEPATIFDLPVVDEALEAEIKEAEAAAALARADHREACAPFRAIADRIDSTADTGIA